jgi:hypothetical protein
VHVHLTIFMKVTSRNGISLVVSNISALSLGILFFRYSYTRLSDLSFQIMQHIDICGGFYHRESLLKKFYIFTLNIALHGVRQRLTDNFTSLGENDTHNCIVKYMKEKNGTK